MSKKDTIAEKIEISNIFERNLNIEISLKPKNCFIVIPIGIPGMGKSTLEESLEKIANSNNYEFFVVSSNETRNNCMKKEINNDPSISNAEAFRKTAGKGKKAYLSLLFDKVNSSQEDLIVYCHKNHPPDIIEKFVKTINEGVMRENVKIIAIAPQCKRKLKVKGIYYPLSINFLITCIYNSFNKEKKTILGDSKNQLGVILTIFKLFKNFDFSLLETMGIDYLVQVPFSNEDVEIGTKELQKFINITLISFRMKNLEENKFLNDIHKLIGFTRIPKFSNEHLLRVKLNEIFSKKTVDFSLFNKKNQFSQLTPLEEKKLENVFLNKIEKKAPQVNLGILFPSYYETKILEIIIDSLSELYSFYHDENIKYDLDEITMLKDHGLKSANDWSFFNKLFATIFSNEKNTTRAETNNFERFVEGQNINAQFVLLGYCPRLIICAQVSAIDQRNFMIENSKLSLNLLQNKKSPNYDNIIFTKIDPYQDISVNEFKEGIYSQVIYSYRLNQKLLLNGEIKSFF